MKYLIQLKNGETREISILLEPVFRCNVNGDASDHFKTKKDIQSDSRNITILDENDPHRFVQKNIGFVRDENTLFQIYRSLKNPIVKLELKD